jgi:hypothetical protein
VISVLDHEELEEKMNYRCLCDVRRGQKQIDQQVIWLPADSTLLCAYPQSALIRNYKVALFRLNAFHYRRTKNVLS